MICSCYTVYVHHKFWIDFCLEITLYIEFDRFGTHEVKFKTTDWFTKTNDNKNKDDELWLEFEFMKHYKEPNCMIPINPFINQVQSVKKTMNSDVKNDDVDNKETEATNNAANNNADKGQMKLDVNESCEFVLKMEYDVCETQQWIVKPFQNQVAEDEIVQRLNHLQIGDVSQKNDMK